MSKHWIATLFMALGTVSCTERLRCVDGQEFRSGTCVAVNADATIIDADVSVDTFIDPCSVCSANQQCIANVDAGADAGSVRCVECTQDVHCDGRFCNPASNTCVECLGDSDCQRRDPAYPVCDRRMNLCRRDASVGRVCASCSNDRDCTVGHRCAAQSLQSDAGPALRYCFQESSSPCPVGSLRIEPTRLPDGTTVGLCLTRDTVSCEAFANYRAGQDCTDSNASVCGAGGACRNNRCTYTCFGEMECVTGTCSADNTCAR